MVSEDGEQLHSVGTKCRVVTREIGIRYTIHLKGGLLGRLSGRTEREICIIAEQDTIIKQVFVTKKAGALPTKMTDGRQIRVNGLTDTVNGVALKKGSNIYTINEDIQKGYYVRLFIEHNDLDYRINLTDPALDNLRV
jgi:hypothetical protein